MANLPDQQNNGVPASESPYTDDMVYNVVSLYAKGRTIGRVATKLTGATRKRDKKRWMAMYKHLLAIEQDPRFEAMMFARTRGELVRNLPQVGRNAVRMSRRRMDAAKWVGEATGFHNPRVDHNVQGDIQITMNIPRPEPVEVEAGPVVDADVVEE